MEFKREPATEGEDVGLVAFLLSFPFFFGDLGRFFRGRRAVYIVQDARGIVDGAAQGRLVAVSLEELNREHGRGHIFGSKGDDALGIVGSANGIAKLETGFDKSAVNLWTLAGLGVILEEFFEVADQGGAVVAGAINGHLQLGGF